MKLARKKGKEEEEEEEEEEEFSFFPKSVSAGRCMAAKILLNREETKKGFGFSISLRIYALDIEQQKEKEYS